MVVGKCSCLGLCKLGAQPLLVDWIPFVANVHSLLWFEFVEPLVTFLPLAFSLVACEIVCFVVFLCSFASSSIPFD